MARSRIAAMSASCLLALAVALGSAEAQTAGAPLPLLQIDHAKSAVHVRHAAPAGIAKAKSTAKAEHRRIARQVAKAGHAKTRVADAGHDLPSPPATGSQATPQNDAQNVWPTAAATGALGYAATPKAPDGRTAALAPSAAPGSVMTEHVVDTDPNGILNGGHAVPAAMSAPVTPAAAPNPQPAVAAKPATAIPSPPVKVAAVAPAAPKTPLHAMLFRPSAPSAVGSASWIAQLLAALGGAIAAGAVAWFLIRPAPERHYG
jgi:hypothetical protein